MAEHVVPEIHAVLFPEVSSETAVQGALDDVFDRSPDLRVTIADLGVDGGGVQAEPWIAAVRSAVVINSASHAVSNSSSSSTPNAPSRVTKGSSSRSSNLHHEPKLCGGVEMSTLTT